MILKDETNNTNKTIVHFKYWYLIKWPVNISINVAPSMVSNHYAHYPRTTDINKVYFWLLFIGDFHSDHQAPATAFADA